LAPTTGLFVKDVRGTLQMRKEIGINPYRDE